MKIINYEDKYKQDLDRLLKEFSEEIYDGNYNTDRFLEAHWAVYLAVKDDTVIGFTSYCFNDYFGFLDKPVISNSYLFISKPYRKSKAMLLFSLQTGIICEDLGVDLEHCYASDETNKLSRKLKGKDMFRVSIIENKEVVREYKRLASLFKRMK